MWIYFKCWLNMLYIYIIEEELYILLKYIL